MKDESIFWIVLLAIAAFFVVKKFTNPGASWLPCFTCGSAQAPGASPADAIATHTVNVAAVGDPAVHSLGAPALPALGAPVAPFNATIAVDPFTGANHAVPVSAPVQTKIVATNARVIPFAPVQIAAPKPAPAPTAPAPVKIAAPAQTLQQRCGSYPSRRSYDDVESYRSDVADYNACRRSA